MKILEGRTFVGRLKYKEDLLQEIKSVCEKEKISLGIFSVIGAVSRAKMGYYIPEEKKYIDCLEMTKTLEITSCIGNISLNNDEIFVHAHITLADHEGNCFGGHLMPGTEIFAAEYYVKELTGAELRRGLDSETGLRLWDCL